MHARTKPDPDSAALRARYDAVRNRTCALAEPLSAEDCCAQSMPDASPIKWHLAHVTWFFETFILERFEPAIQAFRPFNPIFRVLFNSYYNGIGEKHPRAQRGLLTRPSLAEVIAYRRDVDARMHVLLAQEPLPPELAMLAELGLQHEQQHQELMLTDVKHLLSMNPARPAYIDASFDAGMQAAASELPQSLEWLEFGAGIIDIGHRGDGFCFDNETPCHRQFTEAFALASRLVTNGEFLAFIEAGGYDNPTWWLAEGWDWQRADQLTQPLYWQREHGHVGAWQEFTLHGLQPLALQQPVMHLSYFEADAYARWSGARLPTEAEWERAASGVQSHADSRGDLPQLFGAAWQWTASSYAPYPGYVTSGDALGEYNGKFMVNQYVLRGSSCATPAGHARTTYRNFFPATARWQFSGIRLAR